jgi:hypothetical protein
MAKIKCFSIRGIELWFYSNDHRPPHFHARRKGEWEYKVEFLESVNKMFELVRSTKRAGISKADRELLQEMVEKHRFEILREWEQKVHVHEN